MGTIPSGHDAWVVGDEPVVVIDISGMKEYAKPAAKKGVRKPQKQKRARRAGSEARPSVQFSPVTQKEGRFVVRLIGYELSCSVQVH